MENIIVTGATSFIGVNLIKELISKEMNIYAVTRPDSPKIQLIPKASNINIILADMADYHSLENYIKKPVDCIVHLSWNGTRGAERMEPDIQAKNYEYSMELLNVATQLKCKLIVSAGSQAEYGVHEYPITEDTPCHPNTEYGKQKLRFYESAIKFCRDNNMHFKEPRIFSLYGPGDYDGTMVISTLRKLLVNEDCVFTESKQMWDFLYITDAVKGIIKMIETECPDGVYNLASGISRPLKSYIEEMHQLTDSKSKLFFGLIPYPKTGMISMEPCINKIQYKTGWYPETSFQTGILRILRNMRCYERNDSKKNC